MTTYKELAQTIKQAAGKRKRNCEMQKKQMLVKIPMDSILVFVNDELLGMVETIDFKNRAVACGEYEGVLQQPMPKIMTGEIMFAVNKNRLTITEQCN